MTTRPSTCYDQNVLQKHDSKPPVGDELPFLISWDDLEEWQKDNHYIRTSYRPA